MKIKLYKSREIKQGERMKNILSGVDAKI